MPGAAGYPRSGWAAFFNRLARERGLNAVAESAGTAPDERVEALVDELRAVSSGERT